MPEETMKLRERELGMSLVRGSLNVLPLSPSLQEIIAGLAQVAHGTSSDAPHPMAGRLSYWKAELHSEKLPDLGVPCGLVRLERSGTRYIEVMASVHFRTEYGLKDNDIVEVVVHEQSVA